MASSTRAPAGGARWAWSTLAACAAALGLAVLGGVIVVRTVVLDARTYTGALAEADAAERIYTEVLADPELAALKDDLLGKLGVPPALAPQARSLGVNVLRWVLPPATVRVLAAHVIGSGLAYVRGDRPRLDVEVVVDDVAGRVPPATVAEVRSLLASAADRTVVSLDDLTAATRDVADQLAAGQVPAAIPKVGGQAFDPHDVAQAILDGLGEHAEDEGVAAMVLGAALVDDQRDAIIDGVAVAVAGHAAEAAERLRAEPTIDVTALVAERAGRPVADVVATFDAARDLARWAGPWTGAAAAALAVCGLVALLRLHPPGARRRWWLAGSLVGGGLLLVAVAAGVGTLVGSPLETGARTWGLPPATAALLRDVAGNVGDRIWATVWRFAAVVALAGIAMAAGNVAAARRRDVAWRPVLGVLVAVVAILVAANLVGSARHEVRACNGHVELCDRRYDEVTSAATHNSMSAPDVVPVWPEHDGGLTEQLDGGIRTLLIDTHLWPPLESAGQLASIVQDAEPVLPAALAAALYDSVATVRDGRPGSFLCHIHCAFGAQPLEEGLGEITAFLDANPQEVVTLIIQDDIPADAAEAAFDAADLTRYVHTRHPGTPWPTLGQLIDADERLVVFAENSGPPPSWQASAFEEMQETPFLFLSPDDFTCAPNRGDPDAPLLLMNHWIQRIAPDRTDATVVNDLDVLVDRARACERERGLPVNFLAVNFYGIGDVVEAADVLNGVAG